MATASVQRASSAVVRRAGFAGMLMFPIFAGVVVILTALEWDFLHGLGWTVGDSGELNYPSGLARGPYGVIQILNFLVLGLLGLLFLVGLRTQFVHRASGIVATVALGAFGVAGLLNAMPTDLPGEPASWHGVLHGLGFVFTMLGALVGFVATGLALRGIPVWRGFVAYSILNTPLAALALLGLGFLGQYGFYLALSLILIWFGVIGFRLQQVAAHPPASA